ncbi:MAG: class I SAM-dependent methyltransferase [Geminicoccaceae bacterium]
MSRLDSFIRRMEAQRDLLNATPALIDGIAGPILELGLGNGRTYDHLRGLFPDREIFVFERQLAAHPDCVPKAPYLIVGDIRATLPRALERLPGPAALVHNDIGTGDAIANAEIASWLADELPLVVVSGGVVLSDQPLEHGALARLPMPATLPAERYFLYRRL